MAWDVDAWDGTTRLPGLGRETARLVQALVDDAARDDGSNVCTRRFRDRLAAASYDTAWSFGGGARGVTLGCLFTQGPRQVGLVVSTDLHAVAREVDGRDLDTDRGTVRVLERNELTVQGTTVRGPAVVGFDPDEAAGFSITVDRGTPEQLLAELAGSVAEDLAAG